MSTKTLFTGTLLAVSLTVALAGALAGTVQAGTIWQAKGDGRSVQTQFSEDNRNSAQHPGGGGKVTLQQIDDSTLLFYEIWGNDWSGRECTDNVDQFGNIITTCTYSRTTYDSGYGVIPSTDLQFLATGARLITTTGATFVNNRCTTDTAGPTPVTTCGPATPASFDLSWTGNGHATTATAGASQRTLGTFKLAEVSTLQASSAEVDGVALGHELARAPGTIGTTRGKHVATD
jgi:hypothetical protein